jgi:hypothetical protein
LSRRAKAAIVVTLVAVLAATWWLYIRSRETTRTQVMAANDRKAHEFISHIHQRLPAGTPQPELVAFLRDEHRAFVTSGTAVRTEYWVPIGDEPGSVWYCGSLTAYVSLECENARFARARIIRWSNDCP